MKKIILMLVLLVYLIPASAHGMIIQEGDIVVTHSGYQLEIENPEMVEKTDCIMPVFHYPEDGYLQGEELFYNEVYNHNNVDLVYDEDLAKQMMLELGFKWGE